MYMKRMSIICLFGDRQDCTVKCRSKWFVENHKVIDFVTKQLGRFHVQEQMKKDFIT